MGYPSLPNTQPSRYIKGVWYGLLWLLLSGVWSSPSQALSFIDAVRDGIDGVDGLGGASAVATTADGAFVYATGFFEDSVAIFSRNPESGVLTYVSRISSVDINGQGLRSPNAMVLSNDNRHLYVVGNADNSLTAFTRNVGTGALALLAIYRDGVDGVDGLDGANAVAISPDNQRVYVSGVNEKALMVFARNADSGLLSYIGVQFDDINGALGLDGVTDIAVSQDSLYIYTAATADNALSVYRRNPTVSELEFIGTYQNGVNGLTGLNGAYGVAASPENTFVYVASSAASSVSVFTRNADGTLTFLEQHLNGLNGVTGLGGSRAVVINPNGTEVYVAGTNDSAIAVFDRNPADGTLTFNSETRTTGSAGNLLNGVTELSVSGDGTHVYSAALLSNAVSLFSVVAADVAINVTDNAPVAINSTLTYTITVANNGPSTATGVTITDTLPAGVTFNSATPSQGTCSNTGNTTVTCNIGSLASTANATVTLTLTTPAAVGTGSLTNVATVSSDQPDSNAVNNTVTTDSELRESVPSADLSVTVSGSVEPVATNGTLIYTLTVNNTGPEIATDTVLTATLPANATLVSAVSALQGVTCTQSALTISCPLGSSDIASSTTVTITVTAPNTAGTLLLNANVSGSKNDPEPTNNTTSLTTTVNVIQVDLAVTEVLATPSSVDAGQIITYTVNLANVALDTQATGVTLNTALPAQTRYVSDTIGCTHSSGELSCPFGMLDAAANPTTSVEIVVEAIAPGQAPGQALQAITNTFTVTGNGQDTNPNNNSRVGSIVITGNVVDFFVEIADSANPVPLGETVSYTVTLSNNGNLDAGALLNLSVEATGAVNVGPVTASAGTCTPGNVFSCTLDSLPANSDTTITVPVTPTELGVITFLVVDATPLVADNQQFFEPSLPNTAQVETAVSAASANLDISLEAVPNPALVGSNVVYTARVENSGPSIASNVVINQTLPSTATFVSAESSQGSACTSENNVVSCNVGPINASAAATALITVTPTSVGTLSSTATVTSDTLDEQPINNTTTLEVTTSQASADLTLGLTASPDSLFVDNLLTYTATITNNGPDPATQIVYSNTLPENVVSVSNTVTPGNLGSCALPDSRTVQCTVSSLPASGSATVTLVVRPTIAGSLVNNAEIRGEQFDPNEIDNSALLTSRVNNPATLFYVEAEQDGVNGVQGLAGVNDVVVSPDGAHVYAVGFNNNSVVAFSRNDRDGTLSFAQSIVDGTNGVDGLAQASAVAISPDGTQVYVTGFGEAALAVFNRNLTSGTLSYASVYKTNIDGVTGLDGAFDVVVSADGLHVYVAAVSADAVAVFSRLDTGFLNFVEVQTGITGVAGPNALALSPDGGQLLVGNANSTNFTVFNRDPTSGQLSNPQVLGNGTGGISGLGTVSGVAFSASGEHVYVTSGGGNSSVVVLNRDGNGGLTFNQAVLDNAGGVDSLGGAEDVVVTSDGAYAYVAATNDSAFTLFTRAPTGGLTFLDVLRNGENGINGLGGARAIAVSPGGTHIYVAGFTNNAIAVLRTSGADLSVNITDSEDPIEIGNNVTYTVNVDNNGPDQATGVGLQVTLPPNSTLISATPTQGGCDAAVNGVFSCTLGALDNGASTQVQVVVAPTAPGVMRLTANATASQRDPSGAEGSQDTTVTAVADLTVSMLADPDPASIRVDLAYVVTVTNNGPDTAADIQVMNPLPANTEFVSARVGDDSTVCTFVDGIVACPIGLLSVGGSQTVTITVIPTLDGDLTNTVNVTSATRDPTLPNTVTLTTRVRLRIIEETIDNTGNDLSNYAITLTGAVRGGTVSGTTVSEGLLYDLTIAAESLVRGGQLGNIITNNGVIENVTLLSGTVINGGVLQGEIRGFPAAPATLNSNILAGARVSHVIIGLGSIVSPDAVLEDGVQFVENVQIPVGLDLTSALPQITDSVSGSVAVDLAGDVLGGLSLLQAINALPELRDNGLAYVQTPDTGQLILRTASENVTVLPLTVTQVGNTVAAGITVNNNGSMRFVTADGRQVHAQPAIQQPAAFAQGLRTLGLTGYLAEADGNLTLPGAAQSAYFRARPARLSQTTLADAPLGVELVASPHLVNVPLVLFRFLDRTGVPRQQVVFAGIAHETELRTFLSGMPDTSSVIFREDGTVAVTIDQRSYSALADYAVTRGTPGNLTQLLRVDDINGDGIEEVRIFYQNGDQQVFFMIPLPELVTELAAIPDVQNAGILVSEVATDTLLLQRGNEQALLDITFIDRLPDGLFAPSLTIAPDGSVRFITAAAREVFTQPLVQDLAMLEANIGSFGATALTPATSAGNWVLTLDDTTILSLRPALISSAIAPTVPLGVQVVGSGVVNVPYWQLVYADSEFTRRQQLLYPVAYDPVGLEDFFRDAPTVNVVTFNNDGTVTIDTSDFAFRGLLGYTVTRNPEIATGGLQLREVVDQNGDGGADFEVVYPNGEVQVIYQF